MYDISSHEQKSCWCGLIFQHISCEVFRRMFDGLVFLSSGNFSSGGKLNGQQW